MLRLKFNFHFLRQLAYLCGIVFVLGCLPRIAAAQISVDNIILRFASGQRPVHNVNVRNNSNNVAYVLVEVASVGNPTKNENIEKSKDLIASPKAFSIEPNGVRTVRLLLQAPLTDHERVFRVSFIPQDRGFGDEYKKTTEGRSAIIRVLSGMGMLVFTDPIKPEAKLAWKRSGDKLTITNTGNINIYMADGLSCPVKNSGVSAVDKNAEKSTDKEKKGADCAKLETQRLYPGDRLELTARSSNGVVYLRSDGGTGDYQKVNIPPGDGSSESESGTLANNNE